MEDRYSDINKANIAGILGNVFLAPMLRLLGASKTVLPYAENYLSIILYGAVFQCIAMAGNNFSRAQGNPKNAMISQLIGAGFNILFDYILICIFHMGMQGAAFATIGGQFLSALWQLAFLFGKRTIIPLNATLLKLQLNISKQIIQTGIPAFLMQISNSVLNIILNASLVKYGGDLALSAIGIVTSIQTLILMPITGLMQGQQPLISYNYGALKMERVKETLKYAIIGATMIALIGFIAVQFFTKSIVYMFNDEADVVKLCSHALHIWFMCLPLIGAQVMCANYFQAIGKNIKCFKFIETNYYFNSLYHNFFIDYRFRWYFYSCPCCGSISVYYYCFIIKKCLKKRSLSFFLIISFYNESIQ